DRLAARYLPPVSQGDILSLVAEKPDAIGIIDGYFQLVPAVWHKEILHALDCGIPVFGAASMGALRAAELDAFGMVGVGRIYQWYRSGFLEADDEVAVIHAPHAISHRPLSEAMVNIRATLDLAVRAGTLSLESAQALLGVCAATPYWQRSHQRLVADAARLGLPRAEVDALSGAQRVDQKRLDALEMLDLLAGNAWQRVGRPDFRFNRTTKFERLADRDTCLARVGDGRITTGALIDFYLLEGYRLAEGSVSLARARARAPLPQVIAALRDEGIYETVLQEAVACDQSDGLRPCEGPDSAVVTRYCQRSGLDPARSLAELAAAVGFADPDRFVERLHRFSPAKVSA
ncbi:MAG: TfuA-like protein, partial [Pseudomonadota bacterium]